MVDEEAKEALDDDEQASSPLEELLKVHRKEKKELNGPFCIFTSSRGWGEAVGSQRTK